MCRRLAFLDFGIVRFVVLCISFASHMCLPAKVLNFVLDMNKNMTDVDVGSECFYLPGILVEYHNRLSVIMHKSFSKNYRPLSCLFKNRWLLMRCFQNLSSTSFRRRVFDLHHLIHFRGASFLFRHLRHVLGHSCRLQIQKHCLLEYSNSYKQNIVNIK